MKKKSTLYDYDYDYEIALEILGQSQCPIITAYWQEFDKSEPNQKLLKFLKAKEHAIDELMEELDPYDPKDNELIEAILDPKNAKIFRNP